MSRALRLTAFAALALWSVVGCSVELGRAFTERASSRSPGYARWQFESEPARRLFDFARAVGERVPEGRLIAFATGAGRGDPEVFQSLWMAYALPRHRVIRLSHRRAAQEAEYLAAFGPRVEHRRLGPPERLPGGWLYPVNPP